LLTCPFKVVSLLYRVNWGSPTECTRTRWPPG
jgi:hypothetical protein